MQPFARGADSVGPRQPVLVGVGTCMQREDDLAVAKEPLDLMLDAIRLAGKDASGESGDAHGFARMLADVGHIAVPKGRWRYRNPAGEIARAIGARGAVTVLASVGVLQQSLIGDACQRIANGEIDMALVAGADTGYRILRSKKAGVRASERQQDDGPDISLQPAEELLHPAEAEAGITLPAPLYAIIESAWRKKHGLGVDEHRRRIALLYQRFSEVARDNPEAWRRERLDALYISEPSERNRMQAFPYTRTHCADWSVDQAGALLLCSAGKARSLGIDPSRWVFALGSAESNHMTPVSARADIAACVGARFAGRAALSTSGIDASELDLIDLYSCFPIAVESFADELNLPLDRDLTVTGGMSFAGGPFNNYVLQATCRMARLLRSGKGRTGLVSSVSGILTKQGFGVWSGVPVPLTFSSLDVSAEVADATGTTAVLQAYDGAARVVGYTVVTENAQPRTLVLADTATGARVLASSGDALVAARVERVEFCGDTIDVRDGTFTLT